MPRIPFDLFSVTATLGWEDITATVEAIDPPPTLAWDDGVGALQFSVALYADGPKPDPSPEDLWRMVESFAKARGLERPLDVAMESAPLRLASCSFAWGEDFLRVWQISDGRNFAFVTYTCESGQEGRELVECERIVRTLQFRGTPRTTRRG
jgi:hypothetical protein